MSYFTRGKKNRTFHLIPKTPFRWMYPKVIGSYTFNYDVDYFTILHFFEEEAWGGGGGEDFNLIWAINNY